MKNDLEIALGQSNDALEFYLENVKIDDFRKDVANLIVSNQSEDIKGFKEKLIEIIRKS